MTFIVDASVVCAALLPDEADADATTVLRKIAETGAAAPRLWLLEVANTLTVALRRRRLTLHDKERLFLDVVALPVALIDHSASEVAQLVMPLADRGGLTIYDASYLMEALRHGWPLATLDGKLAVTARREGVQVIP